MEAATRPSPSSRSRRRRMHPWKTTPFWNLLPKWDWPRQPTSRSVPTPWPCFPLKMKKILILILLLCNRNNTGAFRPPYQRSASVPESNFWRNRSPPEVRKKWIWPTRQKPLPTSATAAPNVWRMKRFRRALKNVAESSIQNRRAVKANKRNENKKSNLPHRPRKKLCRQLFRKQVAQNDSPSSRIAIRNEERLFFSPHQPTPLGKVFGDNNNKSRPVASSHFPNSLFTVRSSLLPIHGLNQVYTATVGL